MTPNRLMATVAAIAVGTALAGAAKASTLTDPELLYVSSSATSWCGNGNACVVGGEANPLTSSTLYIDFNSMSGGHYVANPVLLVVGIPSFNSTMPTISPTISFDGNASGGMAAQGGADYYGGTWGPSGVVGGFKSGFAYEYIGLDGSNSESFGNWQSASLAASGSTASSYTLGVYELWPTSTFSAGDNLDVSFTGLASGDVLVAFGCKVTSDTNAPCSTRDSYSTPFTQAGVFMGKTPSVPEPGPLALFAAGLAGLALLLRRKSRSI